MKKVIVFTVLSLFMAVTVQAAEFAAPKGADANITVGQNETRENLYAAGGNVTINGNILGDLYAAAGMVSVNGRVEQDLNAAGGNININGSIGGDLRAAGGNITINSPIGGDLLLGSGNVSVSSNAIINGDFVGGVGNLSLDGPVAGYVRIAGGNITINSRISGDVVVTAQEQLTFGPEAVVTGRIVYKGVKEAIVQDGAQVGNIEFTRIEKRGGSAALAGLLTLATIIKIIALFLTAWLITHFWPVRSKALVVGTHANFLKGFGLGLLAVIVTPIVSVILLVTGIGSIIGLLLLLAFILAGLLGCVLTPVFTGALLMHWFNKQEMRVNWQTILLGVVVLTIIGFIPVLGWLITMILFLAVFGSMLMRLHAQRKEETANQTA